MNKYNKIFDELKKLNVLIIGEGIIDEYYFIIPQGTASKDPIISSKYLNKERYLGGIFATARHLSNFVNQVHIISVLGDYKSNKEFIENNLKKQGNISFDFFIKKNSSTIIKRRFIEPVHYRKLFKMEYNDNVLISEDLSKVIQDKLKELKEDYDLILINDFGHGLFDKNLIDFISSLKIYKAINVQTNSANFGFNPATKYPCADFLSLNNKELRLIFHDAQNDVNFLLKNLKQSKNFKSILLTLGKEGSIFYKNDFNHEKAFITKTVDTVGAGDAVFSISSLLNFIDVDEKEIPKIANAIGAVAVNIIGNKEAVTKEKVLNYLDKVYKNELE